MIDILLNNLFSNAIRHNIIGGKLEITLNEGHLIIKNTGRQSPLTPDVIFKRFQKGKESQGTGLGLTLVRTSANITTSKSTISLKMVGVFFSLI